jgi:hypothetical protein
MSILFIVFLPAPSRRSYYPEALVIIVSSCVSDELTDDCWLPEASNLPPSAISRTFIYVQSGKNRQPPYNSRPLAPAIEDHGQVNCTVSGTSRNPLVSGGISTISRSGG